MPGAASQPPSLLGPSGVEEVEIGDSWRAALASTASSRSATKPRWKRCSYSTTRPRPTALIAPPNDRGVVSRVGPRAEVVGLTLSEGANARKSVPLPVRKLTPL